MTSDNEVNRTKRLATRHLAQRSREAAPDVSLEADAAGESHSLALKADGTVTAWGWGFCGQSTVPSGLSGVNAVVAGGEHSLAL
jgi:alpha-tubulin suppressor-like RCC1 family protein